MSCLLQITINQYLASTARGLRGISLTSIMRRPLVLKAFTKHFGSTYLETPHVVFLSNNLVHSRLSVSVISLLLTAGLINNVHH